MKLLFDENLSWRLCGRLADAYPGCAHVVELGLMQSADQAVWESAKSKWVCDRYRADADFYELATTLGASWFLAGLDCRYVIGFSSMNGRR